MKDFSGRGGRNRTYDKGFGDPCDTISPRPHAWKYARNFNLKTGPCLLYNRKRGQSPRFALFSFLVQLVLLTMLTELLYLKAFLELLLVLLRKVIDPLTRRAFHFDEIFLRHIGLFLLKFLMEPNKIR